MLGSLISYIATWTFWTWFGFAAQVFFAGRFLVQWIATERAKRVVVPGLFWWFSIIGGVMILVYSIVRRDPVFVLGSVLALLIYIRNIIFHYRRTDDRATVGVPSDAAVRVAPVTIRDAQGLQDAQALQRHTA